MTGGGKKGEQLIDYEALARQAMRGVVRSVLTKVAKTGLPGEHHFYIAFNTQAPGVGISKRLKEKYPQEMTVVLQHRFWDLAVQDDRFEVKLTFDAIPERLVVPFSAIKVFFDPSVQYGLQFEAASLDAEDGEGMISDGDNEPATEAVAKAGVTPRALRGVSRPARERADRKSGLSDATASDKSSGAHAADVVPASAEKPSPSAMAEKKPVGEPRAQPSTAKEAAKVVQLDTFRKK